MKLRQRRGSRAVGRAVSLVLLAMCVGMLPLSSSGETADPHSGLQRRVNPHAGSQFRQPTTEIERARLAVLQKRFDQALTHLTAALDSELRDETPSSRQLNECWLMLGFAHAQLGNFEEADRYYTKTIESPFFENYAAEDRFKETVLELRAQARSARSTPEAQSTP